MEKISITGAKKDLDQVINRLYSLSLLDIEDYNGELETGSPSEDAEELSELLVDLRSTLSKLPESEDAEKKDLNIEDVHRKLPEIDQRIDDIRSSISEMERKKEQLKDKKQFFEKIKGSEVRSKNLSGSETLSVFVGVIDEDIFRSEAPNENYEISEGEEAKVIFYHNKYAEEFEDAINHASEERIEVPGIDIEGTPVQVIASIEQKKEQLQERIDERNSELEELGSIWGRGLEKVEQFLTEKVEKAEAPLNFATTENAFIAYGWIPSERYDEVESELREATEERIHIQKEEGENPPVKHENNKLVQPFESLTDLVAVPRYNEIDPSFMLLLTFPLFFGFMIGDFGYGLTTLAVFYAGYKMIDGAEDIFKSLMFASFATMIFGLAFGDAFGYVIFGENSVLAQITGIGLFSQIPILFHRANHLGQVFQISALIGVVHINIGYLLGFYNEYVRHDFKEAFLEKGSWLLLEASIALWYFVGVKAGAPLAVLSAVLLYLGEGIEGVVEIPSLLSNVLSYLRIFGVSVAAVALAAVVNGLANPLFKSGSILGITLGVIVLVFGHTFNTFIKIMEGFLQGIRLHYVEMFQKFFEGGGRKYSPFGRS